MRVPGQGSTDTNSPNLLITSRPRTLSSAWRMVRNAESVWIRTPEEPMDSGLKLYLFILNRKGQLLKNSRSIPKHFANLHAISTASLRTALAYFSITSLVNIYMRILSIEVAWEFCSYMKSDNNLVKSCIMELFLNNIPRLIISQKEH